MTPGKALLYPIMVIVISAALVITAFYLSFDKWARDILTESEDRHRDHLRRLVLLAKGSLSDTVKSYTQGSLSKDEALTRVRAEVRRMVSEDDHGLSYIFMGAHDGRMLELPLEPHKELTSIRNFKDGLERYAIREFVRTAQESPEGGFVRHSYYIPDSSVTKEKLTFVLGIPELDAYIGTGIYFQQISHDQQLVLASAKKWSFLYGIFFLMPVFLALGYVVARTRELAQSKAQYEHLVQNISGVIVEWDLNGNVQFINDYGERLFGYSRRELAGRSITGIIVSPFEQNSDTFKQMVDAIVTQPDSLAHLESEVTTRAGERVWLAWTNTLLRNAEGAPSGMLSVGLDYTLHKKAADSLMKSEMRYRSFFSSALDGIFIIKNDSIVDANRQAAQLFGIPDAKFVGTPAARLSPEYQPDGAASAEKESGLIRKALDGLPQRYEWLFQRQDGSLFLADVSLNLVLHADGQMLRASIRDITEIRKTQEVLRQVKERFLCAFHESPLMMLIIDPASRAIIEANDTFVARMGHSHADIQGQTDEALFLWKENAARADFYETLARDGKIQSYETELARRDGSVLYAMLTAYGIRYSGRDEFMLVIRDITARRQREEELREVREKFAAAFRISPLSMTITDVQTGVLIEVNRAFSEIYGYAPEEALGRSALELKLWCDPEDRGRFVRKVVDEGRVRGYETYIRTKSGALKATELSASFIRHSGRQDLLVIAHDVTEMRRKEQALRESEAKFHNAFSMSPDFIVVSDPETGIIYEANDAAREAVGYLREDLVGKNVLELGLWADSADRAAFAAKVRESGECLNYLTHFRSRDGQRVIRASISAKLIDFGGSLRMLSVVRDMTELIRLEDQLRQSQKLEAIGKLAGGVAHDFNNVLTGIIGYAELTRKKLPADSPLASYLDNILSLSGRAGQLSHSLLAFSRKQVLTMQPTPLDAIIQHSDKLLRRLIGADLDFDVTCRQSPVLHVDSVQIELVIMNMVINARDAMPRGGRITISTEMVEVDDASAEKHSLQNSGRFACITVSDTGIGMSQDVLGQIFDPFFTTKEVGKGTGLGLAMAYGIIKQHGGFITAYSEPGVGTQFRIHLPVMHSQSIAEKPEPAEEIPARGTGAILLAEDDENVRDISLTILTEHGYRVLEARDGDEAIAVYQANADTIDLVLLDVIMPKKNGKQVFDAIRAIRPATKVLFLSGYADEHIRSRMDIGNNAVLLYKPVSPAKLLSAVRDAMNPAE